MSDVDARREALFGQRAAMPLQNFLDAALDGKIPAPEWVKIRREKRERIGLQAGKLMEPGMADFFESLVDVTLRAPVVLRGLPPDQALHEALRREGANELVWTIFQLIAEGRGEVPPARGDT